jgi:hypothetical protein
VTPADAERWCGADVELAVPDGNLTSLTSATDGGWLVTRAAELRHWASRGVSVAGQGLDMVTGIAGHSMVTVGGFTRQGVEAASSSIFQVCPRACAVARFPSPSLSQLHNCGRLGWRKGP